MEEPPDEAHTWESRFGHLGSGLEALGALIRELQTTSDLQLDDQLDLTIITMIDHARLLQQLRPEPGAPWLEALPPADRPAVEELVVELTDAAPFEAAEMPDILARVGLRSAMNDPEGEMSPQGQALLERAGRYQHWLSAEQGRAVPSDVERTMVTCSRLSQLLATQYLGI